MLLRTMRNRGRRFAGRRVPLVASHPPPNPPESEHDPEDENEPEGPDVNEPDDKDTEAYLHREMMHRRIFLWRAFGIGVDGNLS
jgi:hypothetical protein